MPTAVSFNVPDGKYDAIIDAWCAQEGYQAFIVDGESQTIPNPETKIQFTKRCLKRILTSAYVRQTAEAARIAAEATAAGEV